ncbi:hypothetical protein EAE96_006478 [Botrytis aclada]|nr:hypothetical protein EAE96_006478 [Botrytis aclada]
MQNQIQLREDIYKRRYESGAWIYSLVDYPRKLTVNERLKITHTIPAILSESRYHTADELEKVGYHFMKGGEKHQFEAHHTDKPPTRFTSHLRLSEIELAQCGLLEEFGKLREIALHPDFQTGLATTMKRKYHNYPKSKGMQYEVGVTKQPGGGVKRLQLAEILRQDTDNSKKDFFHRARNLGQKLLDIWIPGYENTHSFQDIEWHRNTAMTFSEDSNTTLNSIQLNYTKQGTAIADALKGKAHLHCDRDDQPTSYSVVFFMSNFDDCYCPGHFINTTLKTTFPASPFQVYIFSGRTWHCGTGSGFYPEWVGPGHPLRLPAPSITLPALSPIASSNKMRCNMVVYPTRRLLAPKFKELNIELWQPQALHVFANIRTHQEWKLRLFIKQEVLFKLIASLETKVLLQKHFPEWIRNWWWMMTFAPDMFWHGADDLSRNAEERSLAYFKQLKDEIDNNNTKEPLPTKTGKNKKVWPTKEERAVTKRFSTHYEDLADWLSLRTTDPDWFIELFWWIDPDTGAKTNPSRDMVIKTIALVATEPCAQLTDLEEDIAQAYDGFGDYKGDTVFTEIDSPRAFDPAVDTVPANPGWVPHYDWWPAPLAEKTEE